jgi:hypothetical protein
MAIWHNSIRKTIHDGNSGVSVRISDRQMRWEEQILYGQPDECLMTNGEDVAKKQHKSFREKTIRIELRFDFALSRPAGPFSMNSCCLIFNTESDDWFPMTSAAGRNSSKLSGGNRLNGPTL